MDLNSQTISEAATAAMSGAQLVAPLEQRFLLLMILARCLNASGLGLLFSASTDLLYQLTHPRSKSSGNEQDEDEAGTEVL